MRTQNQTAQPTTRAMPNDTKVCMTDTNAKQKAKELSWSEMKRLSKKSERRRLGPNKTKVPQQVLTIPPSSTEDNLSK